MEKKKPEPFVLLDDSGLVNFNYISSKRFHLPVIENDQVIGIVTRSDLMVYFYDQLPK